MASTNFLIAGAHALSRIIVIVVMFLQVSPVPGAEREAADMRGMPARQVLLQGMPAEALGERTQEKMRFSSIRDFTWKSVSSSGEVAAWEGHPCTSMFALCLVKRMQGWLLVHAVI